MAAAFASSVFIGLMLVYVLHLTDETFHSGDQLRAATSLPCYALVPEVSRRALGHVAIQDYVTRRPLTAFAEQIRTLRAGLWFGGDHVGIDSPRVLTVTAARPSEGKSILTLALGRSAQAGGSNVLAIECDVRRPSFIRRLAGTASGHAAPGLAEILRGEKAWRDCLQEDAATGMGYIPAGRPGGDAIGLFRSEVLNALLEEARGEYDLILLDAPPLQAMPEARIIAAAADATLVCVRWRSTPRATLMNALEILQDVRAKVIGTVLTRVDPRAHLRSGYADAEVYHRRYKSYYQG
jgi:Mrp family chromosome partitioning ATPase